MTKALTIIYTTSRHYREKIFAILCAAILVTIFSYVFLLQKAIVNVLNREKIAKQAKIISADVSDLEGRYFALKNAITLDLAHSKGLKDADNISYISKRPLTAMASQHEL